MTLSILLTDPWDIGAAATPDRLAVPKVTRHRFSWKRAGSVGYPRGPWRVFPQREDPGDGGWSDDAEVIAPGRDAALFAQLHGMLAKDVDYEALAVAVGGDPDYCGIVDVIRAMGTEHLDAMWIVRPWTVDVSAY
jgi:hypothetical protein